MSGLSKQALLVENNQSFPNNNAGLISATNLRTFNENMIDSTVNQAVYTADSASFDARIDAGGGGGVPAGTISGSSQVDYPLISNIPSGIISSSQQLPAGLVSGSSQLTSSYDIRYQLSGSDAPLPSGVVSGSSQVSYIGLSNIPSGIISSSQQLPAGLVSGSSQVSSITGSSLVTASFASQTLTFTKGDGTTFGVNIPDVSGSDITALNAFTSSQELLNTTFATTGSNTFDGDQTISGSVTIQDTNAPMSGLVLKNNSGTGVVQIIPAGDFITTFNDSSLTGITNYGGSTLSGSWGEVGDITGGGIGIQNAVLDGVNQAIYLSHGNYDSWVSAPNGTTTIKGETIQLQPSSSAGTSVQVTGDVSASSISTDTLSPKTGGSIQMSTGNFEMTGTGQVINNPNGTVEASEVAASTVLANQIDLNTSTELTINGSTHITASSVTSQGFKVWDGGYTDGGEPFPILQTYSSNDRAASGVAVEVAGGTFFAPGLSSEPLDADTSPLRVTDGIEPRIIVYSQNDASASGTNIELNGNTTIGGAGKDVIIEAQQSGGNGGNVEIIGTNLSLQSGTPIEFNSAMTINGALLINSAIYQGKTTLSFPSASVSNEFDYYATTTTSSPTRLNIDTLLTEGRSINIIVAQGATSGSIETQYSGGPTGTVKLLGPADAVSGSYLTPYPLSGSYSMYVIKSMNPDSGIAVGNVAVVTSYIPNMNVGDITQWQ